MAESVVRSLVRLLVTVGVLVAIYFLILRPILDTTENTFNSAFEGSAQIQSQVNESLESAGIQSIDLGNASEISGDIGEVDLSTAIANAPDRKTKRLLRCIDRANGDISKIQRCTRR